MELERREREREEKKRKRQEERAKKLNDKRRLLVSPRSHLRPCPVMDVGLEIDNREQPFWPRRTEVDDDGSGIREQGSAPSADVDPCGTSVFRDAARGSSYDTQGRSHRLGDVGDPRHCDTPESQSSDSTTPPSPGRILDVGEEVAYLSPVAVRGAPRTAAERLGAGERVAEDVETSNASSKDEMGRDAVVCLPSMSVTSLHTCTRPRPKCSFTIDSLLGSSAEEVSSGTSAIFSPGLLTCRSQETQLRFGFADSATVQPVGFEVEQLVKTMDLSARERQDL